MVNFLQIVLPVKLRRPFIEQLHAKLGHFGRTKTCYAVSRRAYFPGRRSYTGLLVRNCAVCNLHQRSRQTPHQAVLKPMQEFRLMAVLHADYSRTIAGGTKQQKPKGVSIHSVSSGFSNTLLVAVANQTQNRRGSGSYTL